MCIQRKRNRLGTVLMILTAVILGGCSFQIQMENDSHIENEIESTDILSLETETEELSTQSLETSSDLSEYKFDPEDPWKSRSEIAEGHTLEGGERIDYNNPPEINFNGGKWPSNAEPFVHIGEDGSRDEVDLGGYYNEYGYYIVPAYVGYIVYGPDGSWSYNPVTKEGMSIRPYSEDIDPKFGNQVTPPWEEIMVDGKFPWDE